MLILSRVCADFHNKKGELVHRITPASRLTFHGAPESIREDPLFRLLVEEGALEAVDLLTHRPGISYEDYVQKIVRSGNETAIQVKLNDLHHNLWRAKDALDTLDTGSKERCELLGEILRIAEIHDRAEQYIQNAIMPRP